MTRVKQRGVQIAALILLGASLLLTALPERALPSRAHGTGLIVYTTDRVAGQFELFRIRDDGTDDHRLTTHLFADEIDPDWSPDGSKIAFVSDRLSPADIFVMNSDETDQQRLIVNVFRRETDPDWSPDGTQIAFAWDRQGDQFDIWVADLRTGIVRQVTNDAGDERQPAWSPDGRHIAYTCERGGQDEICSVDIFTLEVRRLTHHIFTDERQPTWSPDGAHILFTSFDTIVPAPMTGRSALVSPSDWELSSIATATATTTGTAIVTLTPTSAATATFTSTPTDTPTPIDTTTPTGSATPTLTPTATPASLEQAEIWIMRADGSDPHALIDLGDRVFDPAWSPDGTRIAFVRQNFDFQAHQLDPPRIYIYDLASGSITALGPHQIPVLGQAPDWIALAELPPPPPIEIPSPTSTPVLPPPPPPPPALTPSPTSTQAVPPPPPPPQTPSATSISALTPPPPGATRTVTPTVQPPPPPSPTVTPTATPTITAPPPPGSTCQIILNPGFETGPPAESWTLNRHGASGTLISQAARRSGQWGLRLGVQNNAWDDARQVVSLVCPELSEVSRRFRIVTMFSFWWRVTHDGPATSGDVLHVALLTADGRQLLRLLKTVTDQDADSQWHHTTIAFEDHIGETAQIAIAATTDESDPTTFDVDDVTLTLNVVRLPYQRFLPSVVVR